MNVCNAKIVRKNKNLVEELRVISMAFEFEIGLIACTIVFIQLILLNVEIGNKHIGINIEQREI